MTLQQIMYFLEIAETRHFTKAAQNLYVSQSSLSHAIQLLEKELDVPLFIRNSGKKVMLTSYAEKLLPHCRSIVKEVASAQNEISHMRNPLSGVVTVAYSYVNCASLIPEVFRHFYSDNDYNDIQVEFVINHEQTRMEDELLQGNVDLVFSCTTGIDGLEQRVITKQQLYAMVPADHALACRSSVTIKDLADEQLVCYYHGWNLSNHIENMFKSHGLKPNYSHFVSNWSAQTTMVALGTGVAICPKLSTDENLVRCIPLDDPLNMRNVYISWVSNRKLPPAVEYVRDYCIEYFGNPE